MKKLGTILVMLSVAAGVQGQDKASLLSRMNEKNILNHFDVGVNVGTLGIGVDVTVPVGDYVRVRAGYNYMPRFTFHSNLLIETCQGKISDYFEKLKNLNIENTIRDFGLDPDLPEFQKYKDMANDFRNVTPREQVSIDLRPTLHQFKFLVDVMPFKNKRWSFTAGFFAGPSKVGEACNQESETLLLKAVTEYNEQYIEYLSNGEDFAGHGKVNELSQLFTSNGVAGVPLGYFADGRKAIMVPGKGGSVRAEMKTSKVRPYLGFGYNTHLSRDKKWNLNVDAGVLFLCGKPKVYVNGVYAIDENAPKTLIDKTYGFPMPNYDIIHPNIDYDYDSEDESQEMYFVDKPLSQDIDLMRDLHNIPGKVGDMVNTISKFKVYPNISVSVSYRIF